MQLRQAHAFRVLDNHQAGVGHVDPDLDDRRCYEYLYQALLKGLHAASIW
jgi:hypothetical protein